MKKAYQFFLFFFLIPAIGLAEASLEKKPDSKVSIYSPVGKRDPFRPLEGAYERDLATQNPLERFGVDQLQLRAIMRTGSRPRAMFEDPEGKSHIILEGEHIGKERGTVSRILNTEVIVTQRTLNYLGVESLYEKVISLPQK